VAKVMIGVPEKYELEVSSPAPITSERQHEEYLTVLDRLASKENPTREEEKVRRGLDDANRSLRRKEHHSIPDASPLEVLRSADGCYELHQKKIWYPSLVRKASYPKSCTRNAT